MKAKLVRTDAERPDERVIEEAGAIIRSGGLVAFPTETVYGLGGNALDPEASEKIYAAKGRPSDNPLIVHIADMEDLYRIAEDVPPQAEKLLNECWPGPLTVILNKKNIVPDETTGGLGTVAVRMPSNATAALFIRAAGGFVAAPSANVSGRPSPTNVSHVCEDLGDRIDMIIDGGDSVIGLESTIVDCTTSPFTILRPGYIGEERLRGILGEITCDPALMSAHADEAPKAPGMKYRHYAPKAELTIVEGERKKAVSAIRELVGKAEAEGRRTAVICCDENISEYTGMKVFSLGSIENAEEIAHRLFGTLRELDDEGIEAAFSESFRTGDMGAAVMNRLMKAAGNRIIYV